MKQLESCRRPARCTRQNSTPRPDVFLRARPEADYESCSKPIPLLVEWQRDFRIRADFVVALARR